MSPLLLGAKSSQSQPKPIEKKFKPETPKPKKKTPQKPKVDYEKLYTALEQKFNALAEEVAALKTHSSAPFEAPRTFTLPEGMEMPDLSILTPLDPQQSQKFGLLVNNIRVAGWAKNKRIAEQVLGEVSIPNLQDWFIKDREGIVMRYIQALQVIQQFKSILDALLGH